MVFLKDRGRDWRTGQNNAASGTLRQPIQPNSRLFEDYEAEAAPDLETQDLLELCRSLRHACAAMEAALDRGDTRDDSRFRGFGERDATQSRAFADDVAPHRARPRAAESYDRAENGEREASANSNISMRDMTNFLLSREGDQFLNLIRRMIREEMMQGTPVEGAPNRSADSGVERVRMARAEQSRMEQAKVSSGSLRDILRREAAPRRRNAF